MPSARSRIDTVVLDMDGTLVDTVYQHTLAWVEAFDAVGVTVPVWRLHRAIGMGSDRLVAEVAGDDVEREHGDDVRDGHDSRFEEVLDDLHGLPGAAALLAELEGRDVSVVVASSGVEEQTNRLLDLVDGRDRLDALLTSADADASKPAPDLVQAAVREVGGTHAVVVGDAVWDVRAAVAAGFVAVGLLTGGFGEAELRDAGADAVFTDAADLLDHLDEVLGTGRHDA